MSNDSQDRRAGSDREDSATDRPSARGRAARWLVLTALVPVIGLGVQRAVQLVGRWISPETPTYAAQIHAVEVSSAKDGLRIVSVRRVGLRGPGERSYLVVLRDRRLDAEDDPSPSDQLRIYDAEPSGRLVLALSLKPPRHEGQGREVDALLVDDFARSGFPQVVASFADLEPSGLALPRPIVIMWRPGQDRYETYPLIDGAPAIRGSGSYGTLAARAYRSAIPLADTVSRRTIRAYPAGEEMIARVLDGHLFLIGAYVTQARFANEFNRLRVITTGVDFSDFPEPIGQTCLAATVDHHVSLGRELIGVLTRVFHRDVPPLRDGCLP